MSLMKNTILVLLSCTFLAPLAASARPYHLTSVRWIVDTRNNIDVDDRYVTLVGHVTRRIGGEEYWFADATGQIRLDSENFDLPIGRRVMIGGRIDQAYLGIGHIEVDVRNWHYAPLRKPALVAVHPVTHEVTAPPAPVVDRAPAPAPVETTNPTTTANTTSSQTPSGSISQPLTNATPLTPPAETH